VPMRVLHGHIREKQYRQMRAVTGL